MSTEIKECVRCGYCCKKGPCIYGRSAANSSRCIYLKRDSYLLGTYVCEKWDAIKEAEYGSMFPTCNGSCSGTLFNRDRDRVIRNIALQAARSRNIVLQAARRMLK